MSSERRRYSPYLDPYLELILDNRVRHCRDQERMLRNNLIPVLEREDVVVDDRRIQEALSLQKYFPFRLLPWEVFLVACIVGIRFRDSGRIFFRDIRIMVGRGSGKNGLIDFLCFYFLSPKHGIRGYDVDILANSEDQAKVSFNDLYELLEHPADPAHKRALDANYRHTLTQITGVATQSTLRYNTSSKRGKDSKRTGCIILDEKHEYQDASNINTLRSGLGKRRDGRIITITTDGHVRGAVLDREKEQNAEILRGYDPQNRTLVFYCHIEEEEQWRDPEAWVMAIPSLPYEPFASDLREEIRQEVADMPFNLDYFPEFMAKRMNFPVGNKDVEVATWEDILATNRPRPELSGWPCVGWLDYAKTNDFVACGLIFRVRGDYVVVHHSFVCARSRDLPGIKAPLRDWEKRGLLEFVDEVEIPPELVAQWFFRQGQRYQLQGLALDNYRFALMAKALGAVGFDPYHRKNVKLVRPSDLMKVSPVINSAFVTRHFVWGDDPMLRWYTNNTKKVVSGVNLTYGKIEPNYRKTDGFLGLAAGMTLVDQVPEAPASLGLPAITF